MGVWSGAPVGSNVGAKSEATSPLKLTILQLLDAERKQQIRPFFCILQAGEPCSTRDRLSATLPLNKSPDSR